MRARIALAVVVVVVVAGEGWPVASSSARSCMPAAYYSDGGVELRPDRRPQRRKPPLSDATRAVAIRMGVAGRRRASRLRSKRTRLFARCRMLSRSWFQNWFQPRHSRELGCGSARDALIPTRRPQAARVE